MSEKVKSKNKSTCARCVILNKMTSESAWAQLVCTTDPVADPVLISSNRFTIGRAKCMFVDKLDMPHFNNHN